MNCIFKNEDIPINIKSKVYDTGTFPVAKYGLKTMTLTKKATNKLRVMRGAMERAMLVKITETKQKIKK